jgi:E3 ubiquitin-protein ligase SHPRH
LGANFGLTRLGTVEERVLDLASRKRLGKLDPSRDEDTSSENDPKIASRLDQSEARGLQQNLTKLLERKGIGEVVETGELWKCLFGNAEQNKMRESAVKEIHREQRAGAAESRRDAVIAA